MSPFKNKKILKILDSWRDIWAIGNLSSVAHWDLETYMPLKGSKTRGEALARALSIRQKMFLAKDFVSLIHEAEREKDLTDPERGMVRLLLRDLKFYEKIPHEFLNELEKTTNEGTVVWRKAKDTNNFKLFEPYLTKIFEMNKQMAEYLGYKDSPYDALLDLFEEDLTSAQVQSFFDEIKTPLETLLGKIEKSTKYLTHSPLEDAKYDRKKMEELNQKILHLFWNDFERFRMDVSAHPFTTSFGGNDVRITTRYQDRDFTASLLGTVHEFGHALYDLQSDPELEITPVQGGSSLVIHESQSRFWENFIGTSEPFIEYFKKDFEDLLGQKLSTDDLMRYFNKVTPGVSRLEADEVTYHFHIMVRFEVEKALIEGKLKVADLPEFWSSKIKEYLGVIPKNDSEGVLQDIHWSGGSIGYFPTYSLGTFLSAQWASEISKSANLQISKLENYEQIKNWLGEHVHKYGSTYTLEDLLKKIGMTFDPKVNLKHLEEKYAKLYGF
jgi:carboxypeptidase Taq